MSNSDTVRTMYEAFGRGDVPAILDSAGKVVRCDHVTDTATHQRMANGA